MLPIDFHFAGTLVLYRIPIVFAVRDGYKNNFAKRPLPLVWANFRGNFDGAKKGINVMVCPPLVCINALEGV